MRVILSMMIGAQGNNVLSHVEFASRAELTNVSPFHKRLAGRIKHAPTTNYATVSTQMDSTGAFWSASSFSHGKRVYKE